MEEQNKTYKYRAFISYSHKDKAFAKWLHKRIENYKIPKSLREKYPHLPKDLKRSIFRDEEELPTSSVLGDNLRYALDNSKKLIVICSPFSVASKWVNEEIRYFKEVHGEFSVLAIITSGEPKSSNAKEEAFPKSLRYVVGEDGELTDKETEPLAGDARKGNDKEMALMKLIAGVLEVDFADLWEREKREARKRWSIKILVTLMLLGAVWFGYENYTDKINIQKNGKEYVSLVAERNELKRLLPLAKSDDEKVALWIKIDKVNKRLKVVEEIEKNLQKVEGEITKKAVEIYQNSKKDGAKKALEFLDSEMIQKQEEKSVKLLSERWMVKANMNILENNYEKATVFYEKAVAIDFSYDNVLEYGSFLYKQNSYKRAIELYEKLQKERLSKEQRAGILNNLAILYYSDNRLKEAEETYNEALALYRALAKSNPSAYNPNVADTLNNLAILYRANNRLKEAEEAYNEALELSRALAKINPSAYNPNVADTLNNLAVLYSVDNRLKEAEEAYNEALELSRALAKINPSAYNPNVADTLNNLANLYYTDRQLKEAEEVYNEALELSRALAKTNPTAYNPDVATTLNNLAVLYSIDNRLKEAEEAYNEALALRRALAKINPNSYNPDVAMTLNNLAVLYKDNNRLKEAEEVFSEALALRRALAKINPSAYNPDVATTLNNLAVLYSVDNRLKEAEEAYNEALELSRALAKINPNVYNIYVAETLNNLAILYYSDNRLKEAEEAYNEALALRRALPRAYGIDLANSLVMGVGFLNQPMENLDEAEAILQQFKGIPQAERLLGIIQKIRNKR